jgi:hypothetical protein
MTRLVRRGGQGVQPPARKLPARQVQVPVVSPAKVVRKTLATSGSTPQSVAGSGGGRFVGLDDAIREDKQRSEMYAAKRAQNNRLYFKRGESREIVILDHGREGFFRFWEHTYKGPDGKWGHTIGCRQEQGLCPACLALPDARSYNGLFLTVLVLTPYETKAGDIVPYSKKLLVLKPSQLEAFVRVTGWKSGASIRGMAFTLHKDMPKSPCSMTPGFERRNPVTKKVELVTRLTEAQLSKYKDVSPVDYFSVFKTPSEVELRALFSGGAGFGDEEFSGASEGAPEWD